jgi:hypothetical protein
VRSSVWLEEAEGGPSDFRKSPERAIVQRAIEEAGKAECVAETSRCVVPRCDGVGHGGGAHGHEGNDIDEADPGVDPGMGPKVEVGDDALRQVDDRIDQLRAVTDEGQDAAMMIGVLVEVQATRSALDELVKPLRVPALADVDHRLKDGIAGVHPA